MISKTRLYQVVYSLSITLVLIPKIMMFYYGFHNPLALDVPTGVVYLNLIFFALSIYIFDCIIRKRNSDISLIRNRIFLSLSLFFIIIFSYFMDLFVILLTDLSSINLINLVSFIPIVILLVYILMETVNKGKLIPKSGEFLYGRIKVFFFGMKEDYLIEIFIGYILFVLPFDIFMMHTYMNTIIDPEKVAFFSALAQIKMDLGEHIEIFFTIITSIYLAVSAIFVPAIKTTNELDRYVDDRNLNIIEELISEYDKHIVILGYGKLASIIGSELPKYLEKTLGPSDFNNSLREIILPNYIRSFVLKNIVALTDDEKHLDYVVETAHGDKYGFIKLRPSYFVREHMISDLYIVAVLGDATNEESLNKVKFDKAAIVISTIGEGASIRERGGGKEKPEWGELTEKIVGIAASKPLTENLHLIRFYDSSIYQITAPIDAITNLHMFNTTEIIAKSSSSLISMFIERFLSKTINQDAVKFPKILFISSNPKADILVRRTIRNLYKAYPSFINQNNVGILIPSNYLKISAKPYKNDNANEQGNEDKKQHGKTTSKHNEKKNGKDSEIEVIEFHEEKIRPSDKVRVRFFDKKVTTATILEVMEKFEPDIVVVGESRKEDIIGTLSDLYSAIRKLEKNKEIPSILVNFTPLRSPHFFDLACMFRDVINRRFNADKYVTFFHEASLDTLNSVSSYLLGIIDSYLEYRESKNKANNNSSSRRDSKSEDFVSLIFRARPGLSFLTWLLTKLSGLRKKEGISEKDMLLTNVFTFFSRSNKYHYILRGLLSKQDMDVNVSDNIDENIAYTILANYAVVDEKSESILKKIVGKTSGNNYKDIYIPIFDDYAVSDITVNYYLNLLRSTTREVHKLEEYVWISPKKELHFQDSESPPSGISRDLPTLLGSNKSRDFYEIYILGVSFPGSLARATASLLNWKLEDKILQEDGEFYMDIRSFVQRDRLWLTESKPKLVYQDYEIHGVATIGSKKEVISNLEEKIVKVLEREFPYEEIEQGDNRSKVSAKGYEGASLVERRLRVPPFKLLMLKVLNSAQSERLEIIDNIIKNLNCEDDSNGDSGSYSYIDVSDKDRKKVRRFLVGSYRKIKFRDNLYGIILDPFNEKSCTVNETDKAGLLAGAVLFLKDDDFNEASNLYFPRFIIPACGFLKILLNIEEARGVSCKKKYLNLIEGLTFLIKNIRSKKLENPIYFYLIEPGEGLINNIETISKNILRKSGETINRIHDLNKICIDSEEFKAFLKNVIKPEEENALNKIVVSTLKIKNIEVIRGHSQQRKIKIEFELNNEDIDKSFYIDIFDRPNISFVDEAYNAINRGRKHMMSTEESCWYELLKNYLKELGGNEIQNYLNFLSFIDALIFMLSERIFKIYSLLPVDLDATGLKMYYEGTPRRFRQYFL